MRAGDSNENRPLLMVGKSVSLCDSCAVLAGRPRQFPAALLVEGNWFPYYDTLLAEAETEIVLEAV